MLEGEDEDGLLYHSILYGGTTRPPSSGQGDDMDCSWPRALGLLLMGMILGAIEFGLDTSLSAFKIAALSVSGFELLVVFGGILADNCIWPTKDVTKATNRQYIKSIVEEIVGYTALVFSAVAAAAEKAYKFDTFFHVAGMILLILDSIFLVFVLLFRFWCMMHFFKTFDKIRREYLNDPDVDHDITDYSLCCGHCCKSRTPGCIISRYTVTIVGNFFMGVGLMMMLFGTTINAGIEIFQIPELIAIMGTLFVIVPISSFFIFLLINYYWLAEIFILVFYMISKSEKVKARLSVEKDQARVKDEVLHKFKAFEDIEPPHVLKSKLIKIQKMGWWKKFMFVEDELSLGFVVFIWAAVCLVTLGAYFRFAVMFDTSTVAVFGIFGFAFVLFVVNCQSWFACCSFFWTALNCCLKNTFSGCK